jgi:ferrochelatase
VDYQTEANHPHDTASRTAVLLVNLGTPASPDTGAVRRYLAQFLSDPRVVEIPRLVWWPVLHGVILRVRPAKSAARYRSIWTNDGSPLLVHSRQQAHLLRGWLGQRGIDVDVALAMRYGEPSIPKVLAELQARRVERLLVVPLYPQYSGTTTASVFDAVGATLAHVRNVPELRWVRHFHDQASYIEALKRRIVDHWRKFGDLRLEGGKLVMSFHGTPKRTLLRGDPYHCECLKTARLLGEALQMREENWVVTFQSRFGRAQWLQPYTVPTLEALARGGTGRVDVVCPGFTSDCLETLEEIAQEARAAFLAAGGKTFNYVPCLNDSPAFIDALADLAQRHLQGWPVTRPEIAALQAGTAATAARAAARGAAR